jgi:hypothetical protein
MDILSEDDQISDLLLSDPNLLANRHEHLHKTYEILVQLIMHEGAFVSERTSNFLMFNSILFATLVILPTQISSFDALRITLPVIGLIMSVIHSVIITHTMDAADFWRSSICLIEEDQCFWYPEKVKNDDDLDVFSARSRFRLNSNLTRQKKSIKKLSDPPKLIKKLSSILPEPNRYYVFWLPFFICFIWFVAFIWVLKTL